MYDLLTFLPLIIFSYIHISFSKGYLRSHFFPSPSFSLSLSLLNWICLYISLSSHLKVKCFFIVISTVLFLQTRWQDKRRLAIHSRNQSKRFNTTPLHKEVIHLSRQISSWGKLVLRLARRMELIIVIIHRLPQLSLENFFLSQKKNKNK